MRAATAGGDQPSAKRLASGFRRSDFPTEHPDIRNAREVDQEHFRSGRAMPRARFPDPSNGPCRAVRRLELGPGDGIAAGRPRPTRADPAPGRSVAGELSTGIPALDDEVRPARLCLLEGTTDLAGPAGQPPSEHQQETDNRNENHHQETNEAATPEEGPAGCTTPHETPFRLNLLAGQKGRLTRV